MRAENAQNGVLEKLSSAMTLLGLRAVYLLFAAFGTWGQGATDVQAQKKLSASEAKEHYGKNATVCGDVVSAPYAESSKGQPTFLNVDKPYPNQIFTVVIWGENFGKFGKPEDDYKDERVCVTGKITAYAGSPEIVVAEPKQIAVQTTK